VDLRQDVPFGRAGEGEARRAGDCETNVEAGAGVVNDDPVTAPQTVDVTEDALRAARAVDVAGHQRRADHTGDCTAAIPEGLLPHRVTNRAHGRVHHVAGCAPDPEHARVDVKRWNAEP